jgi:hypothetical protein
VICKLRSLRLQTHPCRDRQVPNEVVTSVDSTPKIAGFFDHHISAAPISSSRDALLFSFSIGFALSLLRSCVILPPECTLLTQALMPGQDGHTEVYSRYLSSERRLGRTALAPVMLAASQGRCYGAWQTGCPDFLAPTPGRMPTGSANAEREGLPHRAVDARVFASIPKAG